MSTEKEGFGEETKPEFLLYADNVHIYRQKVAPGTTVGVSLFAFSTRFNLHAERRAPTLLVVHNVYT